MEYKFKKGDRVVALRDSSFGTVKKGWIGTVDEHDDAPFVCWDNGNRTAIGQSKLELYKPTPQVKIAVSFENDSEKMAYLRYCESIGKVCIDKSKPTSMVRCLDSLIDFDEEIGHAQISYYTENGYSIVPFKVFAALKGIDYTPIVEVKLNDTHTATIENGKVKVGCQTFEFDRIEALYNAVKESKK